MNPAPRPPAWKVAPKPAPAPKRSLLARLFGRRPKSMGVANAQLLVFAGAVTRFGR